jgi:hypothetical protein
MAPVPPVRKRTDGGREGMEMLLRIWGELEVRGTISSREVRDASCDLEGNWSFL